MKNFIKISLLILAIAFMSGSVVAEEWHTDYDKAVAESEATGNPIFMLFTGSDWCKWCVKLEGEILSKDAFQKYAKKNLVLLMFDFPRNKPISKAQMTYNTKMKAKYRIQGYPTILLLKDGKVINKIGYEPMSPKEYVEFVKSKLK